jgi:hypothetical protein
MSIRKVRSKYYFSSMDRSELSTDADLDGPVKGDEVYDKTTLTLYKFDGVAWYQEFHGD